MKGVEGIGRGAANAFPTKAVKGKSFELAGFTLDNPRVSFSYGGTDTTHRADRMGILGNSLFRNFVLYVDYSREKVVLEKGAQFNFQFPVNNSGLQLILDAEDNVVTLFVSPDSPAEKAGFRKGDMLKSINGIEIGYFDTIVAIRELLTKKPGTEYKVVVSRDGQDKKLALTLAYLY
jgi:membrane-associated protease RseP (regulator of RpoE activity)